MITNFPFSRGLSLGCAAVSLLGLFHPGLSQEAPTDKSAPAAGLEQKGGVEKQPDGQSKAESTSDSSEKGDTAERPLGDFIRFREDEGGSRLETALKSYENANGVKVDLVGVVHIADKTYYQDLDKRLGEYEAVLYELVGDPEAFKNREQEGPNALRDLQKVAGKMLKLDFQLENIDYTRENFIHADLTAEQFAELQAKKGENLMSLLFRAMRMQEEGQAPKDDSGNELSLGDLILAVASNGADGLKTLMAKMFDKAENMLESFEGEDGSVILTERNKVVAAKLKEVTGDGKKHVAIFYGAGHLPRLEHLIQDQGFELKDEIWLPAWKMAATKMKSKRAEEPKEEAEPKSPKPNQTKKPQTI